LRGSRWSSSARRSTSTTCSASGSGSRGSIARVIIGGQSLSLLITLLITPVAYSLFDDLGVWLPARLGWLRERFGSVLAAHPRARLEAAEPERPRAASGE
jgi:HAE1 family hydrophobic/amphiphilic exporter-1